MTSADGLRPFSIPSDSPLARGWRRSVAELLERHGLHELLDVLSAYAELRCRHEPDNCSTAEEAAQGGWYSWCTWRQAAKRRIDSIEMPADRRQALGQRGPGRPRLE